MADSESFFLAYRKLFDPANELHPHAQNVPACPGFAWLDIVANARWRNGGGLARGEWQASVRFLAARWNWSPNRVIRFLRMLEHRGAIKYTPQRRRGRQHPPACITVCNYERYQVARTAGGHRHGDAGEDAGGDAGGYKEVRSKKGRTSVQGSSTSPPSEKPQRSADADTPWPEEMREEQQALREAGLLTSELNDPEWWKAQYAWLKSEGAEVYLLTEFKKWWAHQLSMSGRRRHKALKRSFRNWLATAARWSEREQQRRRIRGER